MRVRFSDSEQWCSPVKPPRSQNYVKRTNTTEKPDIRLICGLASKNLPNPVSPFGSSYYIRCCYVRFAYCFTKLTFGPHAPAAFDQIPPYFSFSVFLSVGGDPRFVQHFAAEQLQQSVCRYRRAVAAEHPRAR